MSMVNLKSLVSRFDDACRRTLEAAAGLCLSRTNYNVEVEHWLLKLLEVPDSDLQAIFHYYGVNTSRLAADLTRVLDRFKTGNSRPPALSPDVVALARTAWLIGSIEYGAGKVRSGHLLCALLADEPLARQANAASQEFQKISVETLKADFPGLCGNTAEAAETAAAPLATGGGTPSPGAAPVEGGVPGTPSSPSLNQYTIDLTARARAGRIDPVLGRDSEIRQIVDILTRRRQNNPILTGEAGVGKTAVVEGFAQRVAAGDVPPPLQNVVVRTLDLALLQAGAGMKGEFEDRLKSVIEEANKSPQPIILFIDEAHTMIGAGGQAGQGDAANLLKPALARGELRTIAATTWAEYKKYFEKDAALARRFQVVKVDEPSEQTAIEMMRGMVATLEGHHAVRILDEAVEESVRLSHRYISGRQLPDKSISLLDTACARVAIGQTATPPAIEDRARRIEQLDVALEILDREQSAGGDHADEIAKRQAEREATQRELDGLKLQWNEERRLVGEIRDIRDRLEADRTARRQAGSATGTGTPGDGRAHGNGSTAPAAPPAATGSAWQPVNVDSAAPALSAGSDTAATQAEQAPAPATAGTSTATDASTDAATQDTQLLTDAEQQELKNRQQELNAELRELQGEQPLMQVCVDTQTIAEVVAGWTGIPVGRMVSDEISTVLALREKMEEAVVGQSHALEVIARSIRTSRAGMASPTAPIGVFLLAGTSGVGKTETAITLANLLYGGEQNMTTINMSEFKEEHKVSLLMGSPPGYVGYGEGGVLTEAVRRKPYSVVLLDEMEKAHPGVQDIFYQVFDKGTMKDGEGRDIDFRNTVILMTSNAGSDLIRSLCADPETRPDPEPLREALHGELLNTFKPAFLGRLQVVPYYPLTDDIMRMIIGLKLDKVGRRVHETYEADFRYTPELVDQIASRCHEVDSGARNVDHILMRTLLPELSGEFLSRMAEGASIDSVEVSVDASGRFAYAIA